MAGRDDFPLGARAAGAPVWFSRLFPYLLLALALSARVVAVGRYITPDEPTWVYRSIQFREALLGSNWAGTLVAGHPGVITTWLGAVAMSLQMLFSPEAREAYEWLTTMAFLTPDNVEAFRRLAFLMDSGRVAVAIVNSLGIVVAYFLARRLWGWQVALVAGLFLALDPFLAGLSGLLHVDGLSATFVTISLLALLVGVRSTSSAPDKGRAGFWYALAGSMGALAVLSKTPTLLLIPVTGLAMLWPLVGTREMSVRARATALFLQVAVWGVAFTVVILLFFPAAWAAPAAVLGMVGGSANRHLDEALRPTFFMGETAFVHGLLFYPVVLLWRLSPVVWLSVLPLLRLVVSRAKRLSTLQIDPYSILILGVWIVLFIGSITVAAKKFDRYILPVVPVLLLLAAVTWVSAVQQRPQGGKWLLGLVVALQAGFWVVFAAYPLAAYNPLVGGPRTALNVLPVGWGEAIGAAGGYLNANLPDAAQRRAIAPIAPALAPFFAGRTLVEEHDSPDTADFLIVTAGGRQLDPAAVATLTASKELVDVVRFGGLDQGWIYRNPQPVSPVTPSALSEPVVFDERIALTGYSQSLSQDTLTLFTRWRRLTSSDDASRYILRIVISDINGNIWAAQELPLLNEDYFYPPDWANPDTDIVRHPLELPPGIPPGEFDVSLSLIEVSTSGQLPVRVGDGGFQGVSFAAGKVTVTLPETVVSASRMQIPIQSGRTWFDGRLQLLGRREIAAEALAGSRLPVHLFWHAPQGTLPENIHLNWYLRPVGTAETQMIADEPLSRFDTGMWRLGESIQEMYQVPLPPDLDPGHYEILIQPRNGRPDGEPLVLSEIQINNIDRLYELPDEPPVPLEYLWEPLLLAGMGPVGLEGIAGEPTHLTLYWIKQQPHGEVYSVFVHVVDESGATVTQSDHWPGGLPTNILDAGQIVIDQLTLDLPADLPPGRYQLRVGLYLAESGARLPIVQKESGSAIDYVTLPVEIVVGTR